MFRYLNVLQASVLLYIYVQFDCLSFTERIPLPLLVKVPSCKWWIESPVMLNIKFYKPSGTGLDQSIGDEIMLTSCIGLVRFTMIKPILRLNHNQIINYDWVGQVHHPEMWVIVFVKFHNIVDPHQGIDDYFLYMGYTIQLDDRWYTRELQCKWAK